MCIRDRLQRGPFGPLDELGQWPPPVGFGMGTYGSGGVCQVPSEPHKRLVLGGLSPRGGPASWGPRRR
eukprot:8753643-Alexandrium_andersonii.AAC.1